MSALVVLARYISAPIALRYGTSGPRGSSFSSWGWNGSLLTSSVQRPIPVDMDKKLGKKFGPEKFWVITWKFSA